MRKASKFLETYFRKHPNKLEKDDRSSEECDARRSERLQEEHTYVLKRNIYLLHGRNYTKTRKEIQGRKKTKKTKKKSVLPGTF